MYNSATQRTSSNEHPYAVLKCTTHRGFTVCEGPSRWLEYVQFSAASEMLSCMPFDGYKNK